MWTEHDKQQLKRELAEKLASEKEVRKVVVFGSFPHASDPHDLDVAVFQDSGESYLPLAMKYRKLLRSIADRISLDIVPVRPTGAHGFFLDEILKGEVIYER